MMSSISLSFGAIKMLSLDMHCIGQLRNQDTNMEIKLRIILSKRFTSDALQYAQHDLSLGSEESTRRTSKAIYTTFKPLVNK